MSGVKHADTLLKLTSDTASYAGQKSKLKINDRDTCNAINRDFLDMLEFRDEMPWEKMKTATSGEQSFIEQKFYFPFPNMEIFVLTVWNAVF